MEPWLIGCEESGTVTDAFNDRGIPAVSCDILPTRGKSPHIQGDIFDAARSRKWHGAILFPPCTRLCVSGARWFHLYREEQEAAIAFVRELMRLDIERIGLENPVGVLSTRMRKPDQIIQPWQFGHGEIKKTCLWLKNLPPLTPTNIVSGRRPVVHHMAPGPNRSRDRSKTYSGIATAMAEQWGSL